MMFDVICPGCKGRFHETTNQYTEKAMPNGSMFRLKEPYRTSWKWTSFPERSHVFQGALECPNCGASYLVKGRVITVGQKNGSAEKKESPPEKKKSVSKKKPLKATTSTVDELF